MMFITGKLGDAPMALFDFGYIAASGWRERPVTPRKAMRFAVAAGALALGLLLAASPAAAAECKFAPATQMNIDTGVEPLLLIDGTCTDPDYNESTFVVDKTEQLTFQVPDGGPLIPYTEVTGHFPATKKLEDLPPGIRKNLARGKPLPPGIAKKMVPGPMLRELPAYSGYEWRVYGSDLVLVALATGVVADVLAGVFD